MNGLDKLIAWISPERGARRARARMVLDKTRRYDAAAKGRRTDSWLAQGTSAQAELAFSLTILRNRHRDLVRNNPWAARAVQAVVSNTVNHGITAKIAGSKKIAAKWKAWAESTDCDADGRHDIYGLQALVNRTVVESGECLVRRRWRKLSDGYAVPVQLQVIEPDYLDHQRTYFLDSGGRIIQGVEFDAIGRRVAYWLFKDHPGDVLSTAVQSARVPASEVLHIYRMDRPGQVRGVPWGAAAMLTLRDLDDYEDAYLFRQKIANCQVGIITGGDPSITPTDAALPPLSEKFEPGRFDYLPDGKDIKFNTPPVAGDYGPYTRDVLLRVAACYGITFQALTGDLSSVNFSSGRMGWIEMGRNIDGWRWHMLIPQFCNGAAGWFLEAAALSGVAGTDAATFDWTPPRREMIDPVSETAGVRDAVRAGLISLPAALREYGMDSEEVFAEIAESNAKLDELGIILSSDPRNTTDRGLMYDPGTSPADQKAAKDQAANDQQQATPA